MLLEERGRGRPLVFIGGGLTGWASWKPHAGKLEGSRKVLSVQLLNVQLGIENQALPADYSVKKESSALAFALKRFDREPMDWVAWSYGALVTLDFALDHPEQVRTLTLIEPPAFWVLEATSSLDAKSRAERDALRALHEQMADEVTEQQLAAFAIQAGLCPPDHRPESLPAWPSWVEHRRSLRNGAAVFAHRDQASRLHALDKPVLLVQGTGSTYSLHRVIAALGAALPRARIVELPGGHAPQIIAMDEFLTKLAAFQDAP